MKNVFGILMGIGMNLSNVLSRIISLTMLILPIHKYEFFLFHSALLYFLQEHLMIFICINFFLPLFSLFLGI